MPVTLEERVAYLEGKVEEHSYAWQDLRERIIHLEQRFDQRISETNQRISETNQRIFEVSQRIDKLLFFILATLISSIGALIGVVISILV